MSCHVCGGRAHTKKREKQLRHCETCGQNPHQAQGWWFLQGHALTRLAKHIISRPHRHIHIGLPSRLVRSGVDLLKSKAFRRDARPSGPCRCTAPRSWSAKKGRESFRLASDVLKRAPLKMAPVYCWFLSERGGGSSILGNTHMLKIGQAFLRNTVKTA